MGAMTDWNFMTAIILVALFLLWKLEFAATLLNLKAFPSAVPDELRDVMDAQKLDEAREYLTVNARFNVAHSCFSLTVLLVFWFCGGFGWLDGSARSLSGNEVVAGLVFLTALFLGQSLISLPFSVYETFVIENKFGFNRSTPRTFVMDRVKGLLLAAVIGLPISAAVLWIFGNVSNAWLWAWAVVTAFQLLLTWLAPSLIIPLVNKFTPIPECQLKPEIQEPRPPLGGPSSDFWPRSEAGSVTITTVFSLPFCKTRYLRISSCLSGWLALITIST